MPKTRNTRTQRANELHKMLQRGPSLGFRGETMTPDEAERQVRQWLHSWVLSEALDLIPELRNRRPFPMEGEAGHVAGFDRFK